MTVMILLTFGHSRIFFGLPGRFCHLCYIFHEHRSLSNIHCSRRIAFGNSRGACLLFCGREIMSLMEENQAHWSRVSLECFRQFGACFLKHKFSSHLQDWVICLLTPVESSEATGTWFSFSRRVS